MSTSVNNEMWVKLRGNPWAQLPVYWDDEVEAVNRAN